MFCRDCVNFEDRRDIDGTILCSKNHEPRVCCEEFEPWDEGVKEGTLYNMFCSECKNFQEIGNISICAKNHIPGVTCEDFTDIFLVMKKIRQSNGAKTVLLDHVLKNNSNPKPPELLIKIGQKINW